ncbi:hypothetical protein ACJQWK_11865 [Exserohilum turcicum]
MGDRSPEYEGFPGRRSLSPTYEESQSRLLRSPTYEERPSSKVQPEPPFEDHPSIRSQQGSIEQNGRQSSVVQEDHASEHHIPDAEDAPLVDPMSASNKNTRRFTDPPAVVDLNGMPPCVVLQHRPAAWITKKRQLPLSIFAAAVLTKEGLLEMKDLIFISKDSDMMRDPKDPVSGALLGCYDVIGGITLGLAAGPIELGKQASPLLKSSNHSRKNSEAQMEKSDAATSASTKSIPQAAGKVALGAAKGLGRVVTTGLKSPALIMHSVTRGFHNLPKAYGEEVRVYENVTGLRSGLLVSAKSFGHGLGDGLRDFATKPIDGAEKNGIIGFGTGLATGIANLAFKPTAGACGLVGYSSVGVYKSIRKIGASKKENPADVARKLGEDEYQQSTDADRLFVVRLWCQIQMRMRID